MGTRWAYSMAIWCALPSPSLCSAPYARIPRYDVERCFDFFQLDVSQIAAVYAQKQIKNQEACEH